MSCLRRKLNNGLMEFTCHLEMDSDVFKDNGGVPYKYYITDSQQDDPFEYLHERSITGAIKNRFLKINGSGTYVRAKNDATYDTMFTFILAVCCVRTSSN